MGGWVIGWESRDMGLGTWVSVLCVCVSARLFYPTVGKGKCCDCVCVWVYGGLPGKGE